MSSEDLAHSDAVLSLSGVDGLLRYDRIDIPLGRSVIVGRSRRSDLSLRRSKQFRTADEKDQRKILADRAFLKVSRRHVRISYLAEGHIEIWNLSKNGTWVDEKRVDRILLTELPEDGVTIRLAESETLRLTAAARPAPA